MPAPYKFCDTCQTSSVKDAETLMCNNPEVVQSWPEAQATKPPQWPCKMERAVQVIHFGENIIRPCGVNGNLYVLRVP